MSPFDTDANKMPTDSIGKVVAIFASFQRQKLVSRNMNTNRVDVDPPMLVDVTDLVLSKSVQELHLVQDDHPTSDTLVPYGRHFHDGLYRVEVQKSIKEHFGVSSLQEITQAMVDESLSNFKDQFRIQCTLSAKAVLSDQLITDKSMKCLFRKMTL